MDQHRFTCPQIGQWSEGQLDGEGWCQDTRGLCVVESLGHYVHNRLVCAKVAAEGAPGKAVDVLARLDTLYPFPNRNDNPCEIGPRFPRISRVHVHHVEDVAEVHANCFHASINH